MRRIRSGCCARTASGHAAAAPPRSAMNSRRLMPDMGVPTPGMAMRPSPARRSRVPPRGRSDASPAPAASARSSRPSRSRSG